MEDHFWPSSRKRCEFMLGLMWNSSLPVADRVTAAQVALPLVHPKLTSGHANQHSSGAYGFAVPGVNVKERSNSGSRASPTAETGDRVVIRTEGADLSPLDFFLPAMRDPEAPLIFARGPECRAIRASSC
jgi:hypothetical protein